jgi:hypothetical protein
MHRVRIVNPHTDNGSTRGTEVYLDGRKMDGVTGATFEAAMGAVYHLTLTLNVVLEEVEGTARVTIAAVDLPKPEKNGEGYGK